MSPRADERPRAPLQPDSAGAGQPLFFKSWRSWYGLEILALTAIILLLAWIARVFR